MSVPARGPLAGRRVLVGRAHGQADELCRRIEARGGQPLHAALLVILPGDTAAMARAVDTLAGGGYVAVCLTSPNGVDALTDALEAASVAPDVLSEPLIACVGPGTARSLRARLGIDADLVPDAATTTALAHSFPAGHGRVLLPRADIASRVLPEVLAAQGYEPDEVVAYRTVAPDALPQDVLDDLEAGRIDLLAFASSSTVHSFVRLVGERPWRGLVVSIGPVTTGTCEAYGIAVAAEADPHDLDGLVAALEQAAASLTG